MLQSGLAYWTFRAYWRHRIAVYWTLGTVPRFIAAYPYHEGT